MSITIGIPAYNEEANIKFLIDDLLRQDLVGYLLEKIIVSSDGSSDGTVSLVSKYRNRKIRLIANKNRSGLSSMLNQITTTANSEILVVLNADIMINDKNYIKKIIAPISSNKADLTSSAMQELESPTFLGNVLNTSMNFKEAVFENYRKGNNIYTCHGTARAFSKRLYKKIVFKDSIGEDAYSYLFAISNGFNYKYVNSTKGYYRLPTNLKDHERQSIRFIQSKKKFIAEFGKDFINDCYKVPAGLLLTKGLSSFIKNPVDVTVYAAIYAGMILKNCFTSEIEDRWEISKSSKILRTI